MVSAVVSESVEPSPETVTPSASVSVVVRLSESLPLQVKLRVPVGRKPPEPIVSRQWRGTYGRRCRTRPRRSFHCRDAPDARHRVIGLVGEA